MKLQASYIILEDLRFHAYHGVLPQERLTGNDYVINLRLKYDFRDAMLSDRVDDTLNYAEVYRIVSQEMSVPSALLERVAGRIGERLFRCFPSIEEIVLKIIKINPPMGADGRGAGVEIHLVNSSQ